MELEKRISELEATVRLLIENDVIHQKNAKELATAVSTGVPMALDGQEEAIRALDTNVKSLLGLVKLLDARVVALIESTTRHAAAIDRIENTLGLQGKASGAN